MSENSLDYFRELIDELTKQRDEARFLAECRDRELAEREQQVETLTQEHGELVAVLTGLCRLVSDEQRSSVARWLAKEGE